MIKLDIRQYFKKLKKYEPVYFHPNPGNAGDSLQAHATFQLFKDLKIQYKLFDQSKFDPTGKTLIYGGGGGLMRYYYHAREFIERYHHKAKKFIIFPQTIDGNEHLLQQMGQNVDIILREKVSYNHVKNNNKRSNVMMMDDMAFNLNLKETFSIKPVNCFKTIFLKTLYKIRNDEKESAILSAKKILKNYYLEAIHFSKKFFSKKEKILNCFRNDIEKSEIDIPKNNLDLSVILAYGTENEGNASYASFRLLKFIKKFEEVRTNRLHIAIAGALLGKQVKFYPNNYYKCEAIYNFSMKDRFKNVEWMG
jgi:exopolysaccharide biosynthesis predicted pyruvyltransferase EpsI